MEGGNNGESDQTPQTPVERAKKLGLTKDIYGEPLEEREIVKTITQALTTGFEKKTFPEASETSYQLGEIEILESGETLYPHYEFTPPSESTLPKIQIDSIGFHLINGDKKTSYRYAGEPQPEFLAQALDAYEYFQKHGIQISDELLITFFFDNGASGEQLEKLSQTAPHTNELIPAEVRQEAIKQWLYHKTHFFTGGYLHNLTPTGETLKETVENEGRVPYSKFMELSLFGPDGYYSSGKALIGGEIGKDFTTAPETSDLFGSSMGNAAIKVWKAMGKPETFDIVEMGAGTGALADALLTWAKQEQPEFYDALTYRIIEYGDLIAQQQAKIREKDKVQWVRGSAVDQHFPPNSINGVILSNELPDAFPVEVVKKIDGKIKQKYVGIDIPPKYKKYNDDHDKQWMEVWEDPSEDVMRYLEEHNLSLQEDIEEPININAATWQKQLDQVLNRGAIITTDYGRNEQVGGFDKDHPRATRIYPPGSFNSDRVEYKYIGDVDITSSVNFHILEEIAQRDGLKLASFDTQKEFLLKQGKINELIAPYLDQFHKTHSWQEILTSSKKFDEYKKLLSMKEFVTQVLTKGVDLPTPAAKETEIDTSIRLNIGRPQHALRLPSEHDFPQAFKPLSDKDGWITLPFEAFAYLQAKPEKASLLSPDYLKETFFISSGQDDTYRNIVEDSGYTFDLSYASG